MVVPQAGGVQWFPSSTAAFRAGGVTALGKLTLTQLHGNKKTKKRKVNPPKSRFLSNFEAFVPELLGIGAASDLLPAPVAGKGQGTGRQLGSRTRGRCTILQALAGIRGPSGSWYHPC